MWLYCVEGTGKIKEHVLQYFLFYIFIQRRFKNRLALPFHASLLQAIDNVMSLALCPLVMSQARQHFRSSEKQAACEGCFARQCVCSVISLHSGMSRAVHPQVFSKVDVDHQHIQICFTFFFF